MNILFTICGRAGSKGFKNKNLKSLNGVQLVFYSLAVISLYKTKHKEDCVFVALNTDSSELKTLVLNQSVVGDIEFVDRKQELAGDRTPKVDVIKDTLKELEKQNKSFDAIIDLDITSPMRTLADIENIIEEYKRNEDYDLVFSVVDARRSPYFNMVEKKGDYYRKICTSTFTSRQEAPRSYELNASIYAYRPSFLNGKIEKTILDYNCGIVVMRDYLVLDIDSEEDFMMMEVLHRHYMKNEQGLIEVFEEAKRLCT